LLRCWHCAPKTVVMKEILVLCPTQREYRSLPALADAMNCRVVFEDLGIEHFYRVLSQNYRGSLIPDLPAAIESLIEQYRHRQLAGVTSADGYPGMCAASVIAKHLNLSGPPTDKVLLCGHKYYSRLAQQALVPEATPWFALLDPHSHQDLSIYTNYPYFLKPVRSCFSINARTVSSAGQLKQQLSKTLLPDGYLAPFNDLLSRFSDFQVNAHHALLEELLSGQQVTVEGYVWQGQVTVMGIVDSIMFPGTISFRRFQYPSSLPPPVQQEMINIAGTFVTGVGFNNGMFNMELIYNPQTNKVSIIEINPRIASQFPDLYLKVDGTSSYEVMLKLALGQDPQFQPRRGQFQTAASCVLRTFSDQHVVSIPANADIAAIAEIYPDALIEIHAQPGKLLSEQMQDVGSYRYGLVNIGAGSAPELDAKFEHCRTLLPFQFMPADNPHLVTAS
jgi:hypothetical protein